MHTKVWLYEDNAGGLFIGKENGPWYDVTNTTSTFADDAQAYAADDTADWTVDCYTDEPNAPIVAAWQDGSITYPDYVGSKYPGIAATRYIGS